MKRHVIRGGPVALALATLASTVLAVPITGRGTWQATLLARDLDGDGSTDAFYDTELDITWLSDWTIGGVLDWDHAGAWAAGLQVAGYGGWRLPSITMTVPNWSFAGGTDLGFNVLTKVNGVVHSEMAHLFYDTLGNLAGCKRDVEVCTGNNAPGSGLINSGPFARALAFQAWSGTATADAIFAVYFAFSDGSQQIEVKDTTLGTLAVHPGDIGAPVPVPEPRTWMLMFAGLAALAAPRYAGIARQRSMPSQKRSAMFSIV